MRVCSQSKTDVVGAGLDPIKWHEQNGYRWRPGVSRRQQELARSDSDVPRGSNRKALIEQLNLMDPTFKRAEVRKKIT